MKRYLYGLLLLCLPIEVVLSQSLVDEEIQNRLVSESEALSQVLSGIDAEKKAFLTELEQIENKLRQTDRTWELMTARNQSLSAPSLQAPLKAQIEAVYRSLSGLQQFNQNLPEHLHPAEAELEASRNAQAMPSLTLDNEIIATDETLQIQIRLMDEGIARLENLAGGHRFASEALDDDGGWSAGQTWILGPVAFFEPVGEGEIKWISHVSGNRPAAARLLPPRQGALRAAFEGQSGMIALPADPELPYQPKSGISGKLEEVGKGGIWIIPILGFAFIATLSAIFKWMELRRYKLPKDNEVRRIFLESGGEDSMSTLYKPIGNIIERGMRLRDSGDPKLEAKLISEVYLLYPDLTRYLSFIAITASVAPLLGLLGTVSGMIETFDVISVHGTRNAQMLSGGISEALITTEFGLIVAIPALVLHSLLNRRIRRLMSHLEHLARSIAELCTNESRG